MVWAETDAISPTNPVGPPTPIIQLQNDTNMHIASSVSKDGQNVGPFKRPSQRMARNPHVDLRRPEAGMAEQGLDHPDIDTFLDQQRRGGVPETVRRQVRLDLEAPGQGPQPFSERGRAESATFRVSAPKSPPGSVTIMAPHYQSRELSP